MRRFCYLAAPGLLLLISSCSTQPTTPVSLTAVTDASVCGASLSGTADTVSHRLDSNDISLVNWNIQKGKNPAWVIDLEEMNAGPDLLILQEALPHTDDWEGLVPNHFRSFAEGFGRDSSPSGVMTISAAQPLTECELVVHEPWFGTRKATLVTEYGLTGTDDTLLVVNIHGINFTFGVSDLQHQFEQAKAVIAEHRGPVLFSGDFNTWRGKRVSVLEEMNEELGLTALEFNVDHRKRIFGRALDHIYVRGLDTMHTTTMDSGSSDHNPMSVRLRLADEPVRVRAVR